MLPGTAGQRSTDTPGTPGAGLGIGALSRATGVPENTLRTWERRYGYPRAERTPSGHRLFPESAIERIRLVVQALEAGWRPAQALVMAPGDLRSLVGGSAAYPPLARPSHPHSPVLEPWLSAVQGFDRRALSTLLEADRASLGLRALILDRVAPFLDAVGAEWAAGRIGVAQEHTASVLLEHWLQRQWEAAASPTDAPVAVLAGLPGERHGLGLHLVACLLADAGWRLVFLGPDTPVHEMAGTAAILGARQVLVSVSRTMDPLQVRRDLGSLADQSPCPVLAGGAGAKAVRGVRVIGLADLPFATD